MMNETIVLVYVTAADAEAALRELAAAHIPSSATSQAPAAAGGLPAELVQPSEPWRFPGSLFGDDWCTDTVTYSRGVWRNLCVLTVTVADEHVASVIGILDRYDAVDIDEWATCCERTSVDAVGFAAMSRSDGVGITRSASEVAGAVDGGTWSLARG